MLTNPQLIARANTLVAKFTEVNKCVPMQVHVTERKEAWHVGACGYYRSDVAYICPPLCAGPMPKGARAWSYPGYVADRTVYGVIAHELGHHIDVRMGLSAGLRAGAYHSAWSHGIQELAKEAPITSYAPNHAEWFAEMFRLFLTNPDLLSIIRPKTFEILRRVFEPAEYRCWEDVLWDAPEKIQTAALRKVAEARKPKRRKA